MRCPRPIAMTPLRKDLVNVRQVPIAQTAVRCGIDARFFRQFARRGMRERFARFNASRHRLPMVGKVGALDQQHVKLGGINDDEDRNGFFVTHLAWSSRRPCCEVEERGYSTRSLNSGAPGAARITVASTLRTPRILRAALSRIRRLRAKCPRASSIRSDALCDRSLHDSTQ